MRGYEVAGKVVYTVIELDSNRGIRFFRVSKVSLQLNTVIEDYTVQLMGEEYIGCDCIGYSMQRNKQGGVHKHFRLVERWLTHNMPPLSAYSIDQKTNKLTQHRLVLGD